MTKSSYALDLPYPNLTWPSISQEKQIVILDQLCSLLAPIGEHRSKYITASKGKRDNKKKRKAAAVGNRAMSESSSTLLLNQGQESAPPSPPELINFLKIGFNSSQRHLETLAQKTVAPSHMEEGTPTLPQTTFKSLSALFVDRSDQAPILYEHLPLLITTTSLNSPTRPAIRLVSLPKGSSARLSAALHIPRVSMIGLLADAPNALPLVNYVTEHVPTLEVPWLEDVQTGRYLPVAIKAIPSASAGDSKKQRPNPDKRPQSKKQKTLI